MTPELGKLAEEMHAVRHDLLDEHPIRKGRIMALIDSLDGYVEWLHEQCRVNRCVQALPLEMPQEKPDEARIAFLSPEEEQEWKKRGWI